MIGKKTPKMLRVEHTIGEPLEKAIPRIFNGEESMEAVAEELSRTGEKVSIVTAYSWAYRLGLSMKVKRELVRGAQG